MVAELSYCFHTDPYSILSFYFYYSLKPKLTKLREDYLNDCMQQLKEAITNLNIQQKQRRRTASTVNKPLVDESTLNVLTTGEEQRIERCLIMLKCFVQEFEEKTSRGKSNASSNSNTGNSGGNTAGGNSSSSGQLTLHIKTDKGYA